jgi:methionyl-tRNA formyltransferase
MNEGIDAGPIIFQEKVTLSGKESYLDLEDSLVNILEKNITKVLDSYVEGRIKPIPQDDSEATYTTKLTKKDGQIDWKEETAITIDRKVRSLNPWPGTFTIWKNNNLKIIDAGTCELSEEIITPGLIKKIDNEIVVGTLKGSILLSTIQMSGKNPTKAKDFTLGHPDFIGSTLG